MQVNTLILGAGAAGLMCAAHAGPGALVVDHAKTPGEKIRISGGGRCNFTNMHTGSENFLGANPHFCKSALSRYTQWDFLDLVGKHGIPWHEKTLGQLFCDRSSKDIVAMMVAEAEAAGARIWLRTGIADVRHDGTGFVVALDRDGSRTDVRARRLVVATGGKSIPKMGATGFAYRIAAQFGLPVTETRAGLVPLTFSGTTLDKLKPLAGLSAEAVVHADGASFREGLLFTHRGLSGPSILQISSYWREGQSIRLEFIPPAKALDSLKAQRSRQGRKALSTVLSDHLPARLAGLLATESGLSGNLADQSDTALGHLAGLLGGWELTPSGSEGYRTAEVTLGGISTDALSSRSMEATAVPGLYFIGECVDVTGWLGGFNFQWAWSSGWAAGHHIASTATG